MPTTFIVSSSSPSAEVQETEACEEELFDYVFYARVEIGMGWCNIKEKFNKQFPYHHCSETALRKFLGRKIDMRAVRSNPSAYSIAKRCPKRVLTYHWIDDETKAKVQRLSTCSSKH